LALPAAAKKARSRLIENTPTLSQAEAFRKEPNNSAAAA